MAACKIVRAMVDSGAHSFFKAHIDKQVVRDYSFFESDEFWKFIDEYSEFIKKNKHLIDVYVSVDVIFNPELSWKVQKYMEDVHKLHPLPVFHPGEDFKWLKKYIDNYDYIGIGGIGQLSKAQWVKAVGDPAFSMICDAKGIPRVKVHGFAMTSPSLIIDYCFYSVDSSSWFQFGKFGLLIVPKKRNGNFVYDESPHIISVSTRKKRKSEAENFDHLPEMEKRHVLDYIEMKGFKMGSSELEEIDFDQTKSELPISNREVSSKEKMIEEGVCNSVYIRDALNLEFYLDLESKLPPWPHPWKKRARVTSLPI